MEAIQFTNEEHKTFYQKMLITTHNNDIFHKAFFYTMGISPETRKNIHTLFDFKDGCIKPEGLSEPWQTGSTRRLSRLAFNLWNGWTEEGNENRSTPYWLFDCSYSPYFIQAIRLLYPEYCRKLERPVPTSVRKER